MNNIMKVELYIGRSCLGKPGAGGLAYIVQYWNTPNGDDTLKTTAAEGAQGFRLTTDRRMEIMSAVYGLKAIVELIDSKKITGRINQVSLNCDSEYLCDAVNQGWIYKWRDNHWMTSGWKGKKPKLIANRDLWEQLIESKRELGMLGIYLILSHFIETCGEQIVKADNLAYEAATGTDLIADEKYENWFNSVNRK